MKAGRPVAALAAYLDAHPGVAPVTMAERLALARNLGADGTDEQVEREYLERLNDDARALLDLTVLSFPRGGS